MKRKAFTLVELLMVMAVIGILAAVMMMSSTESVTTAKASNIITNLQILKRAVLAWHMDNLSAVKRDGQVTIKGTTHPIQEWGNKDLQLSKYLSHLGGHGINLNFVRESVEGTSRKNTNLGIGCYGVCDGGTERNSKDVEISYSRKIWYVGYRFRADEAAVREKVRAKLQSAGLVFGTPDAHVDPTGDNDAAVWLRVF